MGLGLAFSVSLGGHIVNVGLLINHLPISHGCCPLDGFEVTQWLSGWCSWLFEVAWASYLSVWLSWWSCGVDEVRYKYRMQVRSRRMIRVI